MPTSPPFVKNFEFWEDDPPSEATPILAEYLTNYEGGIWGAYYNTGHYAETDGDEAAIFRGHSASQSGDLSQWQSYNGTVLSRVTHDGVFEASGPSGGYQLYNAVEYTVKSDVVPVGELVFQVNEYGDVVFGPGGQDWTSADPDNRYSAYYSLALLAERDRIMGRSMDLAEPSDSVDLNIWRAGNGYGHLPAQISGTRSDPTTIGVIRFGASGYFFGTDPAINPTAQGRWPTYWGDSFNTVGISGRLAEDSIEFGKSGSGVLQAGGALNIAIHNTTKTISGVNTGTDVFTTSAPHGFTNKEKIQFASTGTLPAPLVAGTTYFVIATNLDRTTFSVSLTRGGAILDITSAGTGTITCHTGNGLQDGSFGIPHAFSWRPVGHMVTYGRRWFTDDNAADNALFDRGDLALDGSLWTANFVGFLTELTSAPTIVGSNQAAMFLRDNGSGKSQVVVQFATGVPIVMATQA